MNLNERPLFLAHQLWPHVRFYAKQLEILRWLVDADEVVVPAGNMLGKDFVSGYVAVSFFLKPWLYFPLEYAAEVKSRKSATNPNPHTVRVITTSVKDDHLRVLWGEIGRFVQSCKMPLEQSRGGPLIVNHHDIKKLPGWPHSKEECKVSYLRGMVSKLGEGMAGHHAAYTLFIGDEASGLEDMVYEQRETWGKKSLIIGNPLPCSNYFRRAVKEGDLIAKG